MARLLWSKCIGHLAPQQEQTSFLLVSPCFRDSLDLSHFDAIYLFIAIVILFTLVNFAMTGGCERGSLTFVSPDTQ